MLSAVIIDDELSGINTLRILINRLNPEIEIVASSEDEEKGISYINSLKPDMVFLDIKMPKLDGFELLDRLQYRDFRLVFTTAHQEYALNAIKNRAFDYLLKPIDPDDLKVCLEKLITDINAGKQNVKSKTLLELPVSDGIVLIKQLNIIRLEASGSYCKIHLKDGTKHLASKNLKYFESVLDPTLFFRCHNSHIINLNEVSKFVNADGLFVLLSDNSSAEISRKNKEILLQRLKAL